MDSLGDALASVLRKRSYARPLGQQVLQDGWERALKAAGAETAIPSSRVQQLRASNLTIEVDSAALRYELQAFRSAELLAALQADGALPPVRRLTFRLRSLSA